MTAKYGDEWGGGGDGNPALELQGDDLVKYNVLTKRSLTNYYNSSPNKLKITFFLEKVKN